MVSIDKGIAAYGGKNIVVLGMAKSGAAVSRLLRRFGADVTINDRKPRSECPEAADLEELGITVICGDHPDGLINEDVDLVVKNPGIPYHVTPVEQAIKLGIPVITEVEVAYQISDAPIIGITGSNGKTTTTTLVWEILKEAGMKPVVAGNIGTVLSEQTVKAREDQVIVAELSSFQLKGTFQFAPKIACILNIYEAHLDYHGSMEDYIDSKSNIFRHQFSGDVTVFNHDSALLRQLKEQVHGQLSWFSRTTEVERGAFVRDGQIVYRDQEGKIIDILPLNQIRLPGEHNAENVLAAVTISCEQGVSPDVIRRVIKRFEGVEHRLEYVEEIGGVKYYNDSKATNPNAAMTAINAFDRPVIWIAGGLDRGIDFSSMKETVAEKVKAVIAYGESASRIMSMSAGAGVKARHQVKDVAEAVHFATTIAGNGDIVLLSPACASWDMYSSFEERGRIFKQAVHNL